MSSLKSFFRKKHRYETQSDLKDVTAEQIVNINPTDVGYYLEKEDGGIPLEGAKKRAMFTLLAIKRQNKTTPNEKARQKAITSFLYREGIKSDPEVDEVINQATSELAQENMAKVRDQIDMKKINNRLRALDNKQPIPYTEEEQIVIRIDAINKGGKRKSKTISKRKRREKTRKGRKGRKTHRRK